MKTFISSVVFALAIALPHFCNANDDVVQVSLSEDGTLVGHVFAMMENEEAPIAGKVTLTSAGQTVSTLETDETGNFSFKDVQPGKYNMIGVAGSYVGNTVIEVTPFEAEPTEEAGEYTAVPLLVAPSYSPQVFESYGDAPVQTFAAPAQSFSTGCTSCGTPEYVEGYSVGGGCSTCGGGCSTCGGGGFSGGGFGGGRFGGGIGGRGLNFRRLALIGGTVGLAVGIGTSSSSPDE